MIFTLKNTFLTATFSAHGAELLTLEDAKGRSYLMRDPRFWGYSAPHLFPVVGMQNKGQIFIDGTSYPMKRHGFARHLPFTVVRQDDTSITFLLTDSPETTSIFPYAFNLFVHYTLLANTLKVTYEIANPKDCVLPFSIGAHPAFWTLMEDAQNFEDFYLVFEKEEHLETIPIDLETGLLKRGVLPLGEHIQKLPLKKTLFQQDALIFHNLRSSYVSLKNTKNPQEIRFHFQEFPFLGIWTPLEDAPFVCLEPWAGHADYEDFQGSFEDKEDNILLAPKETKTFSYAMEILP
ncbi:MAG TPA: galactose mutarotase [Clostridiaceae bacterium]|nr:galactose mutarotase [Clostridiaceae bacterium]